MEKILRLIHEKGNSQRMTIHQSNCQLKLTLTQHALQLEKKIQSHLLTGKTIQLVERELIVSLNDTTDMGASSYSESSDVHSDSTDQEKFKERQIEELSALAAEYQRPVSYTHLTLPTICSV